MGLLDRIDRHMDLMGQMARTVHADISDGLSDGRMSGEELRGAVFRCMHCGSADECVDWLESHADGAEAPPRYCRNRDLLTRLAE